MNYIFLLLAFILNSTANVLLKTGSAAGINLSSYNPIFLFKENIYLIFGFACFSLNAVFYFLALKNIPISLAYPAMVTMSLIFIGTYSAYFLGESFTYYQLFGYSLIILGVVFAFLNK